MYRCILAPWDFQMGSAVFILTPAEVKIKASPHLTFGFGACLKLVSALEKKTPLFNISKAVSLFFVFLCKKTNKPKKKMHIVPLKPSLGYKWKQTNKKNRTKRGSSF